jgi:hypothetical protein
MLIKVTVVHDRVRSGSGAWPSASTNEAPATRAKRQAETVVKKFHCSLQKLQIRFSLSANLRVPKGRASIYHQTLFDFIIML